MSNPLELSKETILAWRKFASDPEFERGLVHLQAVHSPRATGKTIAEITESALSWNGYQKALEDVRDVLTALRQAEKSLDEPSISA